VWKSAVPALERQVFVINNIDQESGLIDLSYSGNPEQYVDCGQVRIEYSGNGPIVFPGARGNQGYQTITPMGGVFKVVRRMALESRINLIFEEPQPGRTVITVNTRYVLNRDLEAMQIGGPPHHQVRHTVNFNSNEAGHFPSTQDGGDGLVCKATGGLEESILTLIK
jgi:hypothetical protein